MFQHFTTSCVFPWRRRLVFSGEYLIAWRKHTKPVQFPNQCCLFCRTSRFCSVLAWCARRAWGSMRAQRERSLFRCAFLALSDRLASKLEKTLVLPKTSNSKQISLHLSPRLATQRLLKCHPLLFHFLTYDVFLFQACTEMVMPLCSDGVHDMFTESKVGNTSARNVIFSKNKSVPSCESRKIDDSI